MSPVEAQVSREMPRYKCHKEVWALKIRNVIPGIEGAATIFPEDAGYAPFFADAAYIAKHNPQAGGYYVVYSDGYRSFSPASAFEEGYSKV
jgi:hypothetical protein